MYLLRVVLAISYHDTPRDEFDCGWMSILRSDLDTCNLSSLHLFDIAMKSSMSSLFRAHTVQQLLATQELTARTQMKMLSGRANTSFSTLSCPLLIPHLDQGVVPRHNDPSISDLLGPAITDNVSTLQTVNRRILPLHE